MTRLRDACRIPGCAAEAELTYLDHGICTDHWNELTADDVPPDSLRMVLGIEADATNAMEDRTMAEVKETTTEAPVKTARKAKAGKKERKAGKATKAKAAKPEKGEAGRKDWVVFAIRLPQAERDAIHKTAGPARATRYVRAVAAAFANEDEGAFKAVLKEARETRV